VLELGLKDKLLRCDVVRHLVDLVRVRARIRVTVRVRFRVRARCLSSRCPG
jgi:hypothetical protein